MIHKNYTGVHCSGKCAQSILDIYLCNIWIIFKMEQENMNEW